MLQRGIILWSKFEDQTIQSDLGEIKGRQALPEDELDDSQLAFGAGADGLAEPFSLFMLLNGTFFTSSSFIQLTASVEVGQFTKYQRLIHTLA